MFYNNNNNNNINISISCIIIQILKIKKIVKTLKCHVVVVVVVGFFENIYKNKAFIAEVTARGREEILISLLFIFFKNNFFFKKKLDMCLNYN